jgi:hypothetical protein
VIIMVTLGSGATAKVTRDISNCYKELPRGYTTAIKPLGFLSIRRISKQGLNRIQTARHAISGPLEACGRKAARNPYPSGTLL